MSEIGEFFITLSTKFDGTGMNAAREKAEETAKGFEKIGIALAAIAASGVIALNSIIKATSEDEAAVIKLNSALKTAGNYSKETSAGYIEMAKGLQRITTNSDESAVAAQTLLTQLGVAPGIMDKTLKAAMNLSSALGRDLQSSAMLLGRAASGNVQMFSRMGVVLDETRVKSEGLSYVLAEVEKRFGGAAQAEAATFSGKIKMLANQIDELKESIGTNLLPIFASFVDKIRSIVDWFNQLSPFTKSLISNLILLGTAFATILSPIALLAGAMPKIIEGVAQLTKTLPILASVFSPATLGVTAFAAAVYILVDAFEKQQRAEIDEIEKNTAYQKTVQARLDIVNRAIDGFDKIRIASAKWNKENSAFISVADQEYLDSYNKKIKLQQKLTDEITRQKQNERKVVLATDQEIFDFGVKTDTLSLEQQIKYWNERLSKVDRGTKEALDIEEKKFDAMNKLNERQKNTFEEITRKQKEEQEKRVANFASFVSSLGGLLNNLSALSKINIDNETRDKSKSINTEFSQRKKTINDELALVDKRIESEQAAGKQKDESLAAQRKKLNDQLNALDDERQSKLDAIQSEADTKMEIERAKIKPLLIAEAMANTALGVTKAIGQTGVFAFLSAALITAAGMAQVSIIQAQKFASGGLITSPTMGILGEGGSPEIALPLNHPNTTTLLSNAISHATTNSHIGGNSIIVNVQDSILSNRQSLNNAADLIGNQILLKLKLNSKIK